MALWGVGTDVNVRRISTEFRLFMSKNPGQLSIRNLRKAFENSDQNGSGTLDYDEFKIDYQALFKGYDRNNDGVIQFQEFIKGICEPLSQTRHKMVDQCFSCIDQDQDNILSYQEILDAYNPQCSQEFVKNLRSKENLVSEIFQNIDEDKDGAISREEFIKFYEEQSVSVPADSQFLDLLKLTWGVNEIQLEQVIDQKLLSDIIKTLRYRLIQQTNGTHEEFLLKKIFNEFDTNQSGNLSVDELYAMTIKLDIPMQKQYLNAIMKKFDRNNNGVIEYQEFVRFLLNDIYK